MATLTASRYRELFSLHKDAQSRPRALNRKRALQDHPGRVRKSKDSRIRKQIFHGADLGKRHSILSFVDASDFDRDILYVMLRDFDRSVVEANPYQIETSIDRSEDAHRKAKEPSIADLAEESPSSTHLDVRHHDRTPWRLEHSNGFVEARTKPKKLRYPVSQPKPNHFDDLLSEQYREQRKLFYEKWAELNRTHDWPSWLVRDSDNRLTGDILSWMFPNFETSNKERREAAITLEAVNVYLRGYKPSEDSPLYGMQEKSVAKRVQRFLKDAKRWWELQDFIQNAEALFNKAEAKGLLGESQYRLTAADELEELRAFEEYFGLETTTPDVIVSDDEDDPEDPLVQIWKARLND